MLGQESSQPSRETIDHNLSSLKARRMQNKHFTQKQINKMLVFNEFIQKLILVPFIFKKSISILSLMSLDPESSCKISLPIAKLNSPFERT